LCLLTGRKGSGVQSHWRYGPAQRGPNDR
jgi:hypothetical protein